MKKNKYISRKCPVCSSENQKEHLYTHRFAAFEGVSFIHGYDVVCCNNCGAVYADGIPSPEEFEKYYKEKSKYEQPIYEGNPLYDRLARILELALPDKSAAIFEISCSMGNFLLAAKKLGYHNLNASDISPACVRHVNNSLGITCIEGSHTALKSCKTAHYDIVCMISVLEHIDDTHEAINVISPLIKEGGLLLICVPNIASFEAMANGPFQEFSTEHLNFYSLDSLANFAGLYGFEPVLSDAVQQGVMTCIFKKTGIERPVMKEHKSKDCALRYIEASKTLDERFRVKLSSLTTQNEKLLVWGTGALTLHLLAEGILHAENISSFIDSNPHYAEGSYQGIPVISPDSLKSRSEQILISTLGWKDDILRTIKHDLGLNNDVICL